MTHADLALRANLTRTTARAQGEAGDARPLDYAGVGFGPSNLAFAIAAGEQRPASTGLFFERAPAFQWHPGMMLEGTRMQISFLKDLVTLRNPTSPFAFVQYLKAKGRLERFINLCDFFPTRLEFQDYLAWVAQAFRQQSHYGATVRRVAPLWDESRSRIRAFRLLVEYASGETAAHCARNVIYSPGGRPNTLGERISACPAIMHAHDFLTRCAQLFPDRTRAATFLVVGDGQSAAEVVKYLRDSYPRAHVHLVISGYALRPADSTPFVNEVFHAEEVDWFYGLDKEARARVNRQLRNTNYGVVESDLIMSLYRASYDDEVAGHRRLSILRYSRLVSAVQKGSTIEAVTEDSCTQARRTLTCDAAILATGYVRGLDETMFEDLLPFLRRDEKGDLVVSRRYRAETTVPAAGGLYVQGLAESTHGVGDTLLSLLPFRSQEIVEDIRTTVAEGRTGTDAAGRGGRAAASSGSEGKYPPQRHLENDKEKMYAVMERFPFATIVSAREGESLVTHVPLTLDRRRGGHGVLFGHMDKWNPQVDLLDDQPILAIFHGPNAYVSPHEYATKQLPTWNSITVHAHGRVRRLTDQKEVVRGLQGICEYADGRPGAYRLSADDPRIAGLIDFIVGFEIDIERLIGRFKLSQDRDDQDQELAKQALIRRTEEGERRLIETVLPGVLAK